jgi:hypothetical protein
MVKLSNRSEERILAKTKAYENLINNAIIVAVSFLGDKSTVLACRLGGAFG